MFDKDFRIHISSSEILYGSCMRQLKESSWTSHRRRVPAAYIPKKGKRKRLWQ